MLIQRLLQSPVLYDVIQRMAGEHQFRNRLAPYLSALRSDARLIDVGGGTGLASRRSPARTYVCLDLDFQKLRRFRGGSPGRLAVVADGAACPFRADTFDAVLCAKVLHHLSDRQLKDTLAETVRVLKPGGMLILADAVCSSRLVSRMLWRLDRGSYPRNAAEIRRALPAEYDVTAWEEFRAAGRHDFVLCVASRPTRAREAAMPVHTSPCFRGLRG